MDNNGKGLNSGLEIILSDLGEHASTNDATDLIEAENDTLAQEQDSCVDFLGSPSPISKSITIAKMIIKKQEDFNRARLEAKGRAKLRLEELSAKAVEEDKLWEEKMKEADNFLVSSTNEIKDKIKEMDEKIEANEIKIKELQEEKASLKHNEELDDLIKLLEILKPMVMEQRELIEMCKAGSEEKNESPSEQLEEETKQ